MGKQHRKPNEIIRLMKQSYMKVLREQKNTEDTLLQSVSVKRNSRRTA